MDKRDSDKIADLENSLARQKERIFELKLDLTNAEKEISKYKQKSDQMTKALLSAVSKADEIEYFAMQKYKMEMSQLRTFHNKWLAHYSKILKRYPLDKDLLALQDFNNKMGDLLGGMNAKMTSVQSVHDLPQSSVGVDGLPTDVPKNASQGLSNPLFGQPAPKTPQENYESEMQRLAGKVGVSNKNNTHAKPLPQNKNFFDTANMLAEFDDIFATEPTQKIKNYMDNQPANTEQASTLTGQTPNHRDNKVPTIPEPQARTVSPSIVSKQSQTPYPKTVQLDYQDAQNPKQNLADIMKELGLMEE